MTMELYPWDLEERVEDAIVAHIEANMGRSVMVVAARQPIEASYPLIVVEAGESDNTDDTKRIDGKRAMVVSVALVTEALNYNGAIASQELNEKCRELHRVIKSELIGWLAGNDLHTELNTVGIAGVAFSLAYIGLQTRDAGDGKLTTTQMLSVIAQPELIETQ